MSLLEPELKGPCPVEGCTGQKYYTTDDDTHYRACTVTGKHWKALRYWDEERRCWIGPNVKRRFDPWDESQGLELIDDRILFQEKEKDLYK